MKKEKKLPDRKFMVTTGSFIAGAVVDGNTGIVHTADHYLAHLRGLTEAKLREYCQKNGWAISEVS
jgi:hypothetical protein